MMAGRRSPLLQAVILLLIGIWSSILASEPPKGSEDPLQLLHSLRFEPPQLDFGVWSVGSVRSHTVTLLNQHSNHSVFLSSVSGLLPTFYSSYFEAKTVPPNGSVTFNVEFLPRSQGVVSTSLQVQTSFGAVRLSVRGEGKACPYRMRPFDDLRIPLNASITSEVTMYNPYNATLRILEVDSSSEDFELLLASSSNEKQSTTIQGVWELKPYVTTTVVQLGFQGKKAGNHSAHLRLTIEEPLGGKGKVAKNVLVLPLEIEVLPEYGIYARNPLLDFGVQLVEAEAEAAGLSRHIEWRHSGSDELMLPVAVDSEMLPKAITYDADQSTITLNPSEILLSSDSGVVEEQRIVLDVLAKHGGSAAADFTYHRVHLLLWCDLYRGRLHYDTKMTVLTPKDKHDDHQERSLVITNHFSLPLLIHSMSVNNSEDMLQLRWQQIPPGFILQPFMTLDVMSFSLVGGAADHQHQHPMVLNHRAVVNIQTNMTVFEIPIIVSAGRLSVFTQTDPFWNVASAMPSHQLHLGTEPRTTYVLVQNNNLIPVKIHGWNMNSAAMVHCSTVFLGCIRARTFKHLQKPSSSSSSDEVAVIDLKQSNYSISYLLDEGDVSVFRIDLTVHCSATRELRAALATQYMTISTAYENITVSIKLLATSGGGRLEVVDQQNWLVHNCDCVPDKKYSTELRINSTFTYPLHLRALNFSSASLKFESSLGYGNVIVPESVTSLGRLYFEPPPNCGECQMSEVNVNYSELLITTPGLMSFQWCFQKMEFILTTREFVQFPLEFMLQTKWSSQSANEEGEERKLPAIEINRNQSYNLLIINNTMDKPILVDRCGPNCNLSGVQRRLEALEAAMMIVVPNCLLADHHPLFRRQGKDDVGEPIWIAAGSSIDVPISFSFQAYYKHCVPCILLHVRSNRKHPPPPPRGLWLSAQGPNRRHSGSAVPFRFSFSGRKLLALCTDEIRNKLPEEAVPVISKIVMRRVFTLENTGLEAIWINSIYIGSRLCMADGFSVRNCVPFLLEANSYHQIYVDFRPDFSYTQLRQLLTLESNGSVKYSYVLQAEVPRNALRQCLAAMPRSHWENRLRSVALVMLLIFFILIQVMVQLDYRQVLYNQTLLQEVQEKQRVYPVFNLHNIAAKCSQSSSLTRKGTTCTAPTEKMTIGQDKRISATGNGLKKRNASKSLQKISANGGVLKEETQPTPAAKTMAKIRIPPTSALPPAISFILPKAELSQSNSSLSSAGSSSSSSSSSIELPINSVVDSPLKLAADAVSRVPKEEKASKSVPRKPSTALKGSHHHQQQKQQRSGRERSKEDKTSDYATAKRSQSPGASPQKAETSSFLKNSGYEECSRENWIHQDYTTSPQKLAQAALPIKQFGKTPGRERKSKLNQVQQNVASENNVITTCKAALAGNLVSQSNRRHLDKRNQKTKTASTKLSYSSAISTSSESNLSTFQKADSHNTTTVNATFPEAEDLMAENCISSPWETNSQVTFSDVLQSKEATRSGSPGPSTLTMSSQVQSLIPIMAASKEQDQQQPLNLYPYRGQELLPPTMSLWDTNAASSVKGFPRQPPLASVPQELCGGSNSLYGYGQDPLFARQHQGASLAQVSPLSSAGFQSTSYRPFSLQLSEQSNNRQVIEEKHHDADFGGFLQMTEQRSTTIEQENPFGKEPVLYDGWLRPDSTMWATTADTDCTRPQNLCSSSALSAFASPLGLAGTWGSEPTGQNRGISLHEVNRSNSSNINTTHLTGQMPVFDPFGLSSIWDDSWQQRKATTTERPPSSN